MLKIITSLSDSIAQAERSVLRLIAIALPLMVLANVAGRAMRNRVCSGHPCDLDQMFGDQRARDRGAQ